MVRCSALSGLTATWVPAHLEIFRNVCGFPGRTGSRPGSSALAMRCRFISGMSAGPQGELVPGLVAARFAPRATRAALAMRCPFVSGMFAGPQGELIPETQNSMHEQLKATAPFAACDNNSTNQTAPFAGCDGLNHTLAVVGLRFRMELSGALGLPQNC